MAPIAALRHGMATMRIDADLLTEALELNAGDCDNYLDRQTGAVIMVFDGLVSGFPDDGDGVDDEDLIERLEADSSRFLRIEPLPSSVGFTSMESFVETLPETAIKQKLARALAGRKPFSSFKDALFEAGDLRARYFAWHDQWLLEQARLWVAEQGLQAEIVVAPRPSV